MKRNTILTLLGVFLVAAPGCSGCKQTQRLNGGGSTFVYPMMRQWADEYNKAKGVEVNYLSKVSPEWKTKVGVGTSVKWPTGIGQKGNEAVARQVSQTAGSIGYIELTYALTTGSQFGLVKNKEGLFIKGSLESVSAA